MMIEIGKQYRVSAVNKKSFIEECAWAKGDFSDGTYQCITASETLRNGSYLITPMNEDEVEILASGEYLDDDDTFEFEEFEELEFEESYDGCSNDYSFSGNGMTDELEEQLENELYEWDDFPENFFREKGFEDVEYRTYIYGPVVIETMEDYKERLSEMYK